MIDPLTFRETIATYEKHGWQLRRVLLRTMSKSALADLIPSDVPVVEHQLDAAWFSRPPADKPVAWELRFLGDSPFAFVEHINESSPDFEQALRAVEDRLNKAILSKRSA